MYSGTHQCQRRRHQAESNRRQQAGNKDRQGRTMAKKEMWQGEQVIPRYTGPYNPPCPRMYHTSNGRRYKAAVSCLYVPGKESVGKADGTTDSSLADIWHTPCFSVTVENCGAIQGEQGSFSTTVIAVYCVLTIR